MLSTIARFTNPMNTITSATHNISITYFNEATPAESYGYDIEPSGKTIEQLVDHVANFLNKAVGNLATPFSIDTISGNEDWFEINLSGENDCTHKVVLVATKKP